MNTEIDFEHHDDATEWANYREDMVSEREAERAALEDAARREWAQANGNDSGYDPYWNL